MKETWYTIFANNFEPTPEQVLRLVNMDVYTESESEAQTWADEENERIKESHPGQMIRVISFSWPITQDSIK